MNLFDVLFMRNKGGIKPDADMFDILYARKLRAAMEKIVTLIGNPLHFKAKKAQTAISTKIAMEPIQDLHGYEYPWPAGGGKNKINIPDTVLSSNAYLFNGDISLPSGSYVFSITKDDGATSTGNVSIAAVMSNGTNATISSLLLGNRIMLFITASESIISIRVYAVAGTYSKAMLESGTTATSYTPYSNICPITGRTSVGLKGCGKNLFDYDESKVSVGETSTGTIRSYYPTGIKNHTITFSAYLIDSESVTDTFINVGKLVDGKLYILASFLSINGSITNRTVTLADGEEAVLISATNVEGAITLNLPKYNIQCELGTEATPYEPYTPSNDLTIQLGDTVYGGTLDVENGELIVDRGYVDLGALDYTYSSTYAVFTSLGNIENLKYIQGNNNIISSSYKTAERQSSAASDFSIYTRETMSQGEKVRSIGIKDSRYSNVTTFKTEVSGQIAVYELATPRTISLTPEQVQILKGVNNIWTDGDEIELTYKD